ncbi:hypothetical protein ZWY2020_001281 [Hordeum vulgare]|nr:hypothetical protein ZWY2020_001281 [Hordeum vulgare]
MDSLFVPDQPPSVLNQEYVTEQSPDELDSEPEGSGCSSAPPGSPSITSRLSLLKLGAVISKLTSFKKKLVRETGFDGLLEIKSWQKINLKYSSYLMDMIDADNSIINLEGQGTLELTKKHVQAVFAIPLGEQTITNEGVDPSEACVEYTRVAAGFCEKGTHSLKAAEAYILRDITVDSRKIDIDCFKIAFVIFAIGHVLAPSAKHDYITIDFWPALNNISKIKQWNWCQYVLRHVFEAVRKFKADVARTNPTIHIVGCHFFLQVQSWHSLVSTFLT